MGINECSKPASKSSWDSQDFGDVNMVLKMVHFRKSSRPQWVNKATAIFAASSEVQRPRFITSLTKYSAIHIFSFM